MDHIKKAYAWQEALELSRRLVQLIEEFSNAESNVLVWHLRQAIVDVPATIAADLHAQRYATLEPVAKLAAELELIHKVYPAVDTSEADEQLDKLLQRMQSAAFNEREPEPETEDQSSPHEESENHDDPSAQSENSAPSATIVVPQVDGVSQPVATTTESRSDQQG